ncbi:MAG: hypothetical protein ACOYIE_08930, partial [Agathobaculum sp.]
MELIGRALRHTTFGKGVVTGCKGNILTVCFADGDKKFLYPDAFADYLTLKDSALQTQIQNLLHRRAAEKNAAQQARQQEQERLQTLRTLRISRNSQAVFDVAADEISETVRTWTVSTGVYLSGYSRGENRI